MDVRILKIRPGSVWMLVSGSLQSFENARDLGECRGFDMLEVRLWSVSYVVDTVQAAEELEQHALRVLQRCYIRLSLGATRMVRALEGAAPQRYDLAQQDLCSIFLLLAGHAPKSAGPAGCWVMHEVLRFIARGIPLASLAQCSAFVAHCLCLGDAPLLRALAINLASRLNCHFSIGVAALFEPDPFQPEQDLFGPAYSMLRAALEEINIVAFRRQMRNLLLRPPKTGCEMCIPAPEPASSGHEFVTQTISCRSQNPNSGVP